jgi:hypothetical protein
MGTWTSSGSDTYYTGGKVAVGSAPIGAPVDIVGASVYNGSYPATGTLSIHDSANTDRVVALGYDPTLEAGYIQAAKAYVGYKPLLLNPNGGNLAINTTGALAPLSIGDGSYDNANMPVQITSPTDGAKYYGVNRGSGNPGALFGWDSAYGGVVIRAANTSDEVTIVANDSVALKVLSGGSGSTSVTVNTLLQVTGHLATSGGNNAIGDGTGWTIINTPLIQLEGAVNIPGTGDTTVQGVLKYSNGNEAVDKALMCTTSDGNCDWIDLTSWISSKFGISPV